MMRVENRIQRFESMAMGLFIHFGLYSQLSMGEWAMKQRSVPEETYRALAGSFTAQDFDAGRIVSLAKAAGMKYIVLTTRHHEGFSLYDTRGLSDFDAPHTPARRDLVLEFARACREQELMPFFYHTTLDWTHPAFEADFGAYLEYLRASVEVLCTHYGEVGGFWFDGNWSRPDADWKLDELYGTIRRLQPDAMIINNTGLHAGGVLEHPEIDSVTFEQQLPTSVSCGGSEKHVAGEMCFTLCGHWGDAEMDLRYKSPAELIENLCACRAVGANYLLNMGPGPQGAVPLPEQAYLDIIGKWMRVNGEAIYQTRPAGMSGCGKNFALAGPDGTLYFFIYDLGIRGDLNVTIMPRSEGAHAFTGVSRKLGSLRWLDNGQELKFVQDTASGLMAFDATPNPYGSDLVVRVAKGSIV